MRINGVATLQNDGGSSFACQVAAQYDLGTVLGYAASMEAQLTAFYYEKVQLEAELAAEKASKAALQLQSDQFAELASHFALVGCESYSP
jgi:hypothetical protein